MATNKTNSKRQKRHKSDIKSETIELLESFAQAKFQNIAEEEEKKKHFLGAENLLDFCNTAMSRSVEQPESDNSDDSNLKIPLQHLNQNESASDSSPSKSALESPSSFIQSEVIQLLVDQKRLHSQTPKFHEPEANSISNVATYSNLSLEWSRLEREYPDFKNANRITEREKQLILRFIYRQHEKPFPPGPKSTRSKIIKLKEYYDTIFKNNSLRNRHRLFYFLCNTYTREWKIKVEDEIMNIRYI